MTEMAETTLTITHPAGLHARPAALFVRAAAGYAASIRVRNLTRDPEREADAKSILSLMTLGVEHGHQILVRASGPDAAAAVEGLRELAARGFEEG